MRRWLHDLLCDDGDDGCAERMLAQEQRRRSNLELACARLREKLERADERLAGLADKRDAAEAGTRSADLARREALSAVECLTDEVTKLRRGVDPDLAAENARLRRLCQAQEDRLAAYRGDPVTGGAR